MARPSLQKRSLFQKNLDHWARFRKRPNAGTRPESGPKAAQYRLTAKTGRGIFLLNSPPFVFHKKERMTILHFLTWMKTIYINFSMKDSKNIFRVTQ